jgi:multidrug efflux pump
MSIPGLFISRPVAATLLTIGIALAGMLAYLRLPVAPLPNVNFPTIVVQAQMAGASPQTMATTVAAPLERHLGAIADVTEMTSESDVGRTRIIMQFALSRNINGAARDVEAAIQAARADLPSSLHSNPSYFKFNPTAAPIVVLALTSKTLTPAQLYDSADTVIQQQLSQINGVGSVELGGAALPAVRVDLQPGALNKYGIGLEDVRAAIAAANADSPKGTIIQDGQRFQIYSNDQATQAADYRGLVIAYRNGAPVYLDNVASVTDSVENTRNAGIFNGKPSVIVIVHPSPSANVIRTVEQIKAVLPIVRAALPKDVNVSLALDRSQSIKGAVDDTQRTLFIAVLLVIGVVYIFLRRPRATLVPAVTLPVAIIGTFGPMYLLGYSLDNLSLMALTIATGFVVDDTVVVLENIQRHIEAGEDVVSAARRGSEEVFFTVISMSLSLIAVFVPILLMPGLIGRVFQEFAGTLSIAILISLVLSVTTTPMLCALVLKPEVPRATAQARPGVFARISDLYSRSLQLSLDHARLVGVILLGLIVLNVLVFRIIPKTFFPEQDTGLIIGTIQGDQSISFQAMSKKMTLLNKILQTDPGVATAAGYVGGRSTNSGFIFISLKPLSVRHVSAAQIVQRLRPKLNRVAGVKLFLVPAQDLRVGGRQSAAEYQYTLTGDDATTLFAWTPKIVAALKKNDLLTDVTSDVQQGGLETYIHIDRTTASRLGLTPSQIDQTLYDAFGQRSVSTIFNPFNQYSVVMELAPKYLESPQSLHQIYISTAGGAASGTQSTQMTTVNSTSKSTTTTSSAGTTGMAASALTTTTASSGSGTTGNSFVNQQTNSIANTGKGSASSGVAVSTSSETMIPLSAIATVSEGTVPISVNHQGGFVAATISFNLPRGVALSQAAAAIEQTMSNINVPVSIHGAFAGTAAAFQSSASTEPLLILAALVAVYVVLGILYENTIHPITILSTIPSAAIGATLALLLLDTPFSIIALIGIFLLIGIVKKNAILMIDVAVTLQRTQGLPPKQAIHDAAVLRLRPILMTTAAAVLGALPLAVGLGQGAALRQPLGITIMGGLILSQVMTLYTTPVVYVFLDRIGNRLPGARSHGPIALPQNERP